MQHAVVFKELVLADDRFEIAAPVYLGLVCFRLKVCRRSFALSSFVLIGTNVDFIFPKTSKNTGFSPSSVGLFCFLF